MPTKKKNLYFEGLIDYPVLSSRIQIDLPPKQLGPVRSNEKVKIYEREYDEWKLKTDRIIKKEQEKRINALCKKYNIDKNGNYWEPLCKALCKEIFPGFKTETPKPGPRNKWNDYVLAMLYVEVKLLIYKDKKNNKHSNLKPSQAINSLIYKKIWSKQLSNISEHRKINTLKEYYKKSLKLEMVIKQEQYIKALEKNNVSIKQIIEDYEKSLLNVKDMIRKYTQA